MVISGGSFHLFCGRRRTPPSSCPSRFINTTFSSPDGKKNARENSLQQAHFFLQKRGQKVKGAKGEENTQILKKSLCRNLIAKCPKIAVEDIEVFCCIFYKR